MGLRDVARFVHVAAALADDVGIAPDEKATLEAYGKKRRAAGDLD
jgi:hypothetical protein